MLNDQSKARGKEGEGMNLKNGNWPAGSMGLKSMLSNQNKARGKEGQGKNLKNGNQQAGSISSMTNPRRCGISQLLLNY
jgi:hypothetical protein